MTQSVDQAAQVPGQVIQDVTLQPAEHWAQVVPQGSRVRIIDLEGQAGRRLSRLQRPRPLGALQRRRHHEVRRHHLPHEGPRHLHRHGGAPSSPSSRTPAGATTPSAGCCSAESNQLRYDVPSTPNCRDTFLRGLAEHGLGKKDIVANLNFFMNVPVEHDGNMALVEGFSNPGDLIELQAEMDVLALVSNCPQTRNPVNAFTPTPIRIILWQP